ncbi:hypothetical protein KI387_036205, partial [Taxus chinensis]
LRMTAGFHRGSFGFPTTAINSQCRSPAGIQPSCTVWKSHFSQKRKQNVFLHSGKITRHCYPVALALSTQGHLACSEEFILHPNLSISPRGVQKVTFHAGETAVTVPFSKEAAAGLSNAINTLLQTFQKKAAATKPQRWESLEFQHSSADGVHVELFCNPNAYSNAFQAKVLMTVGDGNIKVISEGLLSAIKSDIDQFVEMSS